MPDGEGSKYKGEGWRGMAIVSRRTTRELPTERSKENYWVTNQDNVKAPGRDEESPRVSKRSPEEKTGEGVNTNLHLQQKRKKPNQTKQGCRKHARQAYAINGDMLFARSNGSSVYLSIFHYPLESDTFYLREVSYMGYIRLSGDRTRSIELVEVRSRTVIQY